MRLMHIIDRAPNYKIYCDLDGVLADFAGGVKKLLGVSPDQVSKNEMWKAIYAAPTFFLNLDMSPDGKQLWRQISRYNPIVLTGLPAKYKTGMPGDEQKRLWVKKHLGANVPCIVVPSKLKQQYANEHAILIDDRIDNVNGWKARGGIGILHHNLQTTMKELRDLGL